MSKVSVYEENLHLHKAQLSAKYCRNIKSEGTADTFVSTILRHQAAFSMSNVIPLLGYGKMPMKVQILMRNEASENHAVTRNETI